MFNEICRKWYHTPLEAKAQDSSYRAEPDPHREARQAAAASALSFLVGVNLFFSSIIGSAEGMDVGKEEE